MKGESIAKSRIGLLGVGRIGIMHTRILAPKVESLVIADVVPEKVQRAVDELGAQVRSVEDFFDSEDLDGVVLTMPTGVYVRHIEAAVGLGAPIFCEKPVALDIAPTEGANAAAKFTGVPVHIGFQRRFDAAYAATRERLAAGEIGELRRVHMHTLDQAPAAREFLAASGGISTDCLIHDFDVLRWVTGCGVGEVFAFGTDLRLLGFADFSDVCETVLALHLIGGVLATVYSSRFNGAGYDVRMEVHDTEGTDVVGMDERPPVRSLEPGVAFPSGEPWVDFIARSAACYERELKAFLDVVAGRAEVPSTIDDAVASLRVVEVCAASCREGCPVKVARWAPFVSAVFGDDALFAANLFSMRSTVAH